MNRDQKEGKAKDVGGSVKEAAGKAVNDDDLKNDGRADQAEGKVQKAAGDVKDTLSGDK